MMDANEDVFKLLKDHEDIFELVAKVEINTSYEEKVVQTAKRENVPSIQKEEIVDKTAQAAGRENVISLLMQMEAHANSTELPKVGDEEEALDEPKENNMPTEAIPETTKPTVTEESSGEDMDQVKDVTKNPVNKKLPLSFEEMAKKIRKNPEKCYGKLEIVHMIDTGGQPESLEIMPFLIHNAHLILLVVDLSVSLDECIIPTFHKNDRGFKKKSLITCNRELIQQLAQTLVAAQGEENDTNARIFVIATHKDKVEDEEKLKTLKEKLNALVMEIIPSKSVFTKATDESVFDIDLLDPDIPTLHAIRRTVTREMNKMKELDVPLSYVMFERQATVHIKELKRKVNVLKLEECCDFGRRLNMNEYAVKNALKYFNKNNIMLFFEDIGEGLVILDQNTLIDFVNTVIFFSYEAANEDQGQILTANERDSLSKGLITEELLKRMQHIFVPEIFEACHAIKVFKNLYIVAKNSESDYIMMCLLPRLSEEELESWKLVFTTCQPVQPLRLDFGIGDPPEWKQYCSPSGCFGSTIACLITDFNWRICTDVLYDEAPVCFYHDIAILCPKQRLEVTLVNKTKYFEVYVGVDPENRGKYNELPAIRSEIKEAVGKVLKTMKVNLSVAEGFECDCENTKYLIENYAKCKCGLEEEFKSLWIKAEQALMKYAAEAQNQGGGLVRMRQLKKLRIVDKSSKLYKDIGTKLLTTAALVDSISEVANEDPKKAIRLIYRRWIRTDEGHSWRKLTQCFKDVGLNSLARDLEKHFELPSLSEAQQEGSQETQYLPSPSDTNGNQGRQTNTPVLSTSPATVSTAPHPVSSIPVISRMSLTVIARDHLKNWKTFGPFLGLTEQQETAIANNNPHDYDLQKRECLEVWKKRRGREATYRALISAQKRRGTKSWRTTSKLRWILPRQGP
ncbi:hypothetical protein GBAR_LOCUS27538 [Geodia barretti]|uniref:Death domain-containing protein n=1 Tax=Geodia barretti TaxID=519541 RepID=A0AA35TLY5_GEOBA|nr:hypothetical protein GBAR_LOCUS27538 [Geodia barretti]